MLEAPLGLEALPCACWAGFAPRLRQRSLTCSSLCVAVRLPVLSCEQRAEERHQIPAGKVFQRAGALLRPLHLHHAAGAGQDPRWEVSDRENASTAGCLCQEQSSPAWGRTGSLPSGGCWAGCPRVAVSERIPLCSSRGVPARVQDLHPGPAAGQAQNRHREPGQGEQGVWGVLVLGCSRSSARPLCPHGGSCPHPQCFWPGQRVISGHTLQVPWELSALPCTWSPRAWRTHSACRSPPCAPPQHCCPSGCWRPAGLQGSDPCPCSTHSQPWQGAGCVCWALRRHYGARMRGFGAPSFPAGGCWRLCHPEPVPLLWVPQALAATSLLVPCSSGGGLWHPDGGAVARCRSEMDGWTDGRPTERLPLAPRSTWSCCAPTRTGRPSA